MLSAESPMLPVFPAASVYAHLSENHSAHFSSSSDNTRHFKNRSLIINIHEQALFPPHLMLESLIHCLMYFVKRRERICNISCSNILFKSSVRSSHKPLNDLSRMPLR